MSDQAPQPTKAHLAVEGGEELVFLFNPAELRIAKANTWHGPPAKGKNAPRLRFQEGQSGSLSFTAFLDTTSDGSDVTVHTDRLLALMRTNDDLAGADRQRNRARPPWVQFVWGKLHSFTAVVESLTITFTYFASNGKALRARADITLRQYEDETSFALQNPTSSTPAPARVHRVRPGETLDRIAAVHYGDPTRWRLLATANGVLDPFALRAGTDLVVPEPEVVRRDR